MNYHKQFTELKKELGYTNQDIADITGLSLSNIKNQTRVNTKFPSWLKLTLDTYTRMKIDKEAKEVVQEFNVQPQALKEVKRLTSDQLEAMVSKHKSKK